MTLTIQITPKEVKQRLDAGFKLRLVDVREPFEYRQARIEGSELIPMRTVSKIAGLSKPRKLLSSSFAITGCEACRW